MGLSKLQRTASPDGGGCPRSSAESHTWGARCGTPVDNTDVPSAVGPKSQRQTPRGLGTDCVGMRGAAGWGQSGALAEAGLGRGWSGASRADAGEELGEGPAGVCTLTILRQRGQPHVSSCPGTAGGGEARPRVPWVRALWCTKRGRPLPTPSSGRGPTAAPHGLPASTAVMGSLLTCLLFLCRRRERPVHFQRPPGEAA